MNRLGAEIEQDLELVGVTAIEDKLQARALQGIVLLPRAAHTPPPAS